jgi:hypothetical protein
MESLERYHSSDNMSDELTYTVEDEGGAAEGISDRALFDKTNLISNMEIVRRKTKAAP